MARGPTVSDLARAAGVSVATVDRVLHERAPVRDETRARFLAAARQIGFRARAPVFEDIPLALPEVRIGYVLNKERQSFYQALKAEVESAGHPTGNVRVQARVEFSPSHAPGDFAALLDGMAPHVDVVAATAVNHIAVADAVARLRDRNIPCIALLNDFAQGIRQSYIGLNNLKIGRIAAHMISTAVHGPGKIAVFVGGLRWHGHELRETGYRSYFREHRPDVEVLDTLVNLETRQLTYEATLGLLERHPDLVGLYCAGGGMEGAIAALREVREPGDVQLVVNELTPESRQALADRYATMVIGTPLPELCREVVRLAVATRGHGGPVPGGQIFLEPNLYLPESV